MDCTRSLRVSSPSAPPPARSSLASPALADTVVSLRSTPDREAARAPVGSARRKGAASLAARSRNGPPLPTARMSRRLVLARCHDARLSVAHLYNQLIHHRRRINAIIERAIRHRDDCCPFLAQTFREASHHSTHSALQNDEQRLVPRLALRWFRGKC